jgi:hypothetical protein
VYEAFLIPHLPDHWPAVSQSWMPYHAGPDYISSLATTSFMPKLLFSSLLITANQRSSVTVLKINRKHHLTSFAMFLKSLLLAALAVGTSVSVDVHGRLAVRGFHKRQAFRPETHYCAYVSAGSTCEDSCGAGYILCSDPTTFFCYNPGLGEICCSSGSSAACKWFTKFAICITLYSLPH